MTQNFVKTQLQGAPGSNHNCDQHTTKPNWQTNRQGLGILHASKKLIRKVPGVTDHSLTNTLREQYWIGKGKGKRYSRQNSFFACEVTQDLGRNGMNRTLSDPGDDFRSAISHSGVNILRNDDWYEATEYFPIVPAKDINNFMRFKNGLSVSASFDPQHFIATLSMNKPLRRQQHRASDDVIEAIHRKLSKSSYDDNVTLFGFGTLIVGLPLWFATPQTNPLRPENAIDDFMSRTSLGLHKHVQPILQSSECAFRRVVVVWEPSVEAINQWLASIDSIAYQDLSYISKMADAADLSWFLMLVGIVNKLHHMELEDVPSFNLSLSIEAKFKVSRFKPRSDMTRLFDEVESSLTNEKPKLDLRARMKFLRLLWTMWFFFKRFGKKGYFRWLIGRLSLKRLQIFLSRHRARKLYTESRKRTR